MAKPTPGGDGELTDDLIELQPEASSPTKALQPNTPAAERPKLFFDSEEFSSLPFWQRLTPLAKQILLWAGIVGVAGFALSISFGFALGPFNAQIEANNGLLLTVSCLGYLLVLGPPCVAGWRATLREGTARHGGMAGLGSILVAALLGLILDVVVATFQGQLRAINGDYFLSTGEGLLFPLLLGFAMGTLGNSYGSWQRRRAQRKQEVIPS